MSWLEQKYIGLVSTRLDKFKRRNNTYNFRCPVCGDSQKHKNKSRGYIILKDGHHSFFCHNCNQSMSIDNFIKFLDQSLYNEYVKEKLLEKGSTTKTRDDFDEFVSKMKKPNFIKLTALSDLPKISQLKHYHPAKMYIDSRGIPTPYHAKLFYCDRFKKFVNGLIPNKFENEDKDEDRIIIPFLTTDKNLFGFQGRSLDPNSKLRYITIILDENIPKFYNMDTLVSDETVYVFEGPFDAMFVKNSTASAGGKLNAELPKLTVPKHRFTIVYDNEPRSTHTVGKIQSAIDAGYRVCIWPSHIEEKDVNDMVLKRKTISTDFGSKELVDAKSFDVKSIIDAHTYSGLRANMELVKWKKT